jgi:hypothetical protein
MGRKNSDNGFVSTSKIVHVANQTKYMAAMSGMASNIIPSFVNSFSNGTENQMKPVTVSNAVTMPVFTPNGMK